MGIKYKAIQDGTCDGIEIDQEKEEEATAFAAKILLKENRTAINYWCYSAGWRNDTYCE